ncbi:hypothetical protein AAVH_36480, partial [Aphelenchoides avenae]
MQANLPHDPLVRETMATLGPGAKDSTLDDVTAWICQLEELCDSKDAALAPSSFRTDISGSCLSTFSGSGNKGRQGLPATSDLHMEKVSSKKKNTRGEAKLPLRVERGPLLVLLTITDLHGSTRTQRAVKEEENDLIPIKHLAATIEATVIPFGPDQLLARLRLIEAKIKAQREQHVMPSASPQRDVEAALASRPANGVKYWTKRIGGRVLQYIFDTEKETMTFKSSGCCSLACDQVSCTAASCTATRNFRTGEIAYTEKKKILILEKKKDEYAKLTDLMFRTAETGGWLHVPEEQGFALLEKAERKDPKCAEALASRAHSALAEYNKLKEELESTSSESKKKRLFTMLARKETEFDAAINEIAVIAGK